MLIKLNVYKLKYAGATLHALQAGSVIAEMSNFTSIMSKTSKFFRVIIISNESCPKS